MGNNRPTFFEYRQTLVSIHESFKVDSALSENNADLPTSDAPTQMLSLSLTLHFWTYTFSMATAGCTGRACAGGFLGCAVWLRRNSFAVGASST